MGSANGQIDSGRFALRGARSPSRVRARVRRAMSAPGRGLAEQTTGMAIGRSIRSLIDQTLPVRVACQWLSPGPEEAEAICICRRKGTICRQAHATGGRGGPRRPYRGFVSESGGGRRCACSRASICNSARKLVDARQGRSAQESSDRRLVGGRLFGGPAGGELVRKFEFSGQAERTRR